jgi:hypothetical protein
MTLFEALAAKAEQRKVLVRMPHGTTTPGIIEDLEPIHGRGGKFGALVRWELPSASRGVQAVIPLQRVVGGNGVVGNGGAPC